jgi:hypothetical protein
MKYWEIIADNLSKAGWSWGWVAALDSEGRTDELVNGSTPQRFGLIPSVGGVNIAPR